MSEYLFAFLMWSVQKNSHTPSVKGHKSKPVCLFVRKVIIIFKAGVQLFFISCRGISVGLFHEFGPDEIARVSLECKADIMIVENELLLKRVLLIQHKLPDLRAIVQLSGEPPLSDKRRLHKSHKVSSSEIKQKVGKK